MYSKIISASRRTDIPALYPKWFERVLNQGFCQVQNQYGTRDLNLSNPEAVVFWTKNPQPLIEHTNVLQSLTNRHIPYYFQWTITGFAHYLEPNLPSKQSMIEYFKRAYGTLEKLDPNHDPKNKLVWRYDPIGFDNTHTIEYHIQMIDVLSKSLQDFTDTCIISWLDNYNHNSSPIRAPMEVEEIYLAEIIADTCIRRGINVQTCAETNDYKNITHASCIDATRLLTLAKEQGHTSGNLFNNPKKDPNQRKACGCIPSIDVGTYNTCIHGCQYCYANSSLAKAIDHHNNHNINCDYL